VANRNPILKNSEVEISFLTLQEEMPFYFRNADGDDLYFVHSRKGKVETDFGPLNMELVITC
jgi:homogentisate 1,2-dioxygenase